MKILTKIYVISLILLSLSSCFKDIDINEPRIHITPKETFFVDYNIQDFQGFYKFYESDVVKISENNLSIWDMAFESSAEGFRVFPNYGFVAQSHPTEFNSVDDVSVEYIEGIADDNSAWNFDDPAYATITDSLNFYKWENGKVIILKRGTKTDNYIALKFIERTSTHYTFEYKSVTNPSLSGQATITKTEGLSYVYFSFKTEGKVTVEPVKSDWDILVGPYFGWYETKTPGEYLAYRQSGFLINNEAGVKVAQVFDEDIDYDDIDYSFVETREFSDFKGSIGSNWKILGATDSNDLYSMDPNKKYIIKVYDNVDEVVKYYKLKIISYKDLSGKFHYPTVQFDLLSNL